MLGIPADEPLLGQDEVRYRGQPIVAVAAEDQATPLDAVEIEYEERAALFGIRKAMDPDAPKIHVRKGDLEWAFDTAGRHESADDARQRRVHTGNDHHAIGALEVRKRLGDPMESGPTLASTPQCCWRAESSPLSMLVS